MRIILDVVPGRICTYTYSMPGTSSPHQLPIRAHPDYIRVHGLRARTHIPQITQWPSCCDEGTDVPRCWASFVHGRGILEVTCGVQYSRGRTYKDTTASLSSRAITSTGRSTLLSNLFEFFRLWSTPFADYSCLCFSSLADTCPICCTFSLLELSSPSRCTFPSS